MSFVKITKKIKIQSVKSLSGSFGNIDPILPFVTFYIVQAPNSTYLFRHNAMKMAAARPQSVFTADVYLSHNTSHAPTLAFAPECSCCRLDDSGRWGRKEEQVRNICYL